MNRRHDTLLMGQAELAAGRRRHRPGPVGTAAIAAAVLVLIGLGFAVIAPLLSGSPRAEVLPATHASPGMVVAGTKPAPSPSPTVSLLRSLPPAKPGQQAKPSQLEGQAIHLINQARARAGCGQVKVDSHLRKAAREHSDDMARHRFLSHTGSDHSSYPDRARKAGYRRPAGEAIASAPTAEMAVNAWLTDPDQRGVLLNCGAKAVGVGVATARGGAVYWTADFGS